MSALLFRIKATLSFISDTLKLVEVFDRSLSSLLVIMTFISCFSNISFKCNAIFKLSSFSKVPAVPTFPGSLPPWPGSMMIVYFEGILFAIFLKKLFPDKAGNIVCGMRKNRLRQRNTVSERRVNILNLL